MRILVAGASGVIGRHLVPQLVDRGHQVVALSRSGKSPDHRAEATQADVLNAEAARRAVVEARPDVVVQQLTALPLKFNPRTIDYTPTNRLRVEGTRNLLAGMADAGCDRLVAQSGTFFVANEGPPVVDEAAATATGMSARFQGAADAAAESERLTLDANGLVLRYGFFYGPETYYGRDGSWAKQARMRMLSIVGKGDGMTSFIHIEDAASATVAAIEADLRGVYNVTDDEPAAMKDWVPAYCAAVGAPKPMRVPVWMARAAVGRTPAEVAAHGRGSSNAKLRAALPDWDMRYPTWREGFAEGL